MPTGQGGIAELSLFLIRYASRRRPLKRMRITVQPRSLPLERASDGGFWLLFERNYAAGWLGLIISSVRGGMLSASRQARRRAAGYSLIPRRHSFL